MNKSGKNTHNRKNKAPLNPDFLVILPILPATRVVIPLSPPVEEVAAGRLFASSLFRSFFRDLQRGFRDIGGYKSGRADAICAGAPGAISFFLSGFLSSPIFFVRVNEINSFPFLQKPLYYPFISNNLNFPDQSCDILPAISLLQRLRKSDKFHFLIATSSRTDFIKQCWRRTGMMWKRENCLRFILKGNLHLGQGNGRSVFLPCCMAIFAIARS